MLHVYVNVQTLETEDSRALLSLGHAYHNSRDDAGTADGWKSVW